MTIYQIIKSGWSRWTYQTTLSSLSAQMKQSNHNSKLQSMEKWTTFLKRALIVRLFLQNDSLLITPKKFIWKKWSVISLSNPSRNNQLPVLSCFSSIFLVTTHISSKSTFSNIDQKHHKHHPTEKKYIIWTIYSTSRSLTWFKAIPLQSPPFGVTTRLKRSWNKLPRYHPL